MSLLVKSSTQHALEEAADFSSEASDQSGGGGGLDPVNEVLREIAREIGGDTLLVAWHENGGAPAYLTWQGRHAADPSLAAEMVAAACGSAQASPQPLSWCPGADGHGGVMVMNYPLEGGIVTVTVHYPRMKELNRSLTEGEVLRRRPLLEPFFRLWVLQRRTASRATGLVSAINKLDVATFHFDEHGRLLFSNEAGIALVTAGDGLRRSDTSLGGVTLADTFALQSAIDDVIHASDPGASSGRECPVVALTRPNRRPLLAAVTAIDPDQAIQGGTAVIVYVIDPDQELRPRLEPICKLYCLSPVETNLACLLADGASLIEAASQISVREQTARSYLKHIFAKTHTTRQAELVSLLLKSAVLTVTHPIRAISNLRHPQVGGWESRKLGADES